MKELIGLWLIGPAVGILMLFLNVDLTVKEKIKFIISTMAFVTIIMVGCYLIAG